MAENDPKKRIYYLDDDIYINVKTTCDCYVHIFNLDSNGDLTMLLPNNDCKNNKLKANTYFTFPVEEDASIQLQPPLGKDIIKVIATLAPIDFFNLELSQTCDVFLCIENSKVKRQLKYIQNKIKCISCDWNAISKNIEIYDSKLEE